MNTSAGLSGLPGSVIQIFISEQSELLVTTLYLCIYLGSGLGLMDRGEDIVNRRESITGGDEN